MQRAVFPVTRVAKRKLAVVSSAEYRTPSPSAQHVIDHLSHALVPDLPVDEIRRRYTESRRPLLAPMEPVENVFAIVPDGDAPSLTVFCPRGSRKGEALPALLYLHGGGWTVGDLRVYEPLCRQLANATRCAVIWAEYRLAPEHPFPAAFDDTRAALAWIRTNHALLGIDRERIGIAGDSAGGNLAAAVSLAEWHAGGQMPWVQILLYPCLDLMACMPSHKLLGKDYLLTAELYAWYRANYAQGQVKMGHWRLSPLFAHDVRGQPPSIVLHAGFDPLRDEAAAYAARLRNAQVPVEELHFPGLIHGFLTMGGVIPEARSAIARIASALYALTGHS